MKKPKLTPAEEQMLASFEHLFRPNYYYRLDEKGEPVACNSYTEWVTAHFPSTPFQFKGRIVGRTKIGASHVMTDFMPMRLDWCGGGPPVVWETMVFGGGKDMHMERCSGSREQALAMHEAVCAEVRAAKKKKAKSK